jgi:hypothetical protein
MLRHPLLSADRMTGHRLRQGGQGPPHFEIVLGKCCSGKPDRIDQRFSRRIGVRSAISVSAASPVHPIRPSCRFDCVPDVLPFASSRISGGICGSCAITEHPSG